VPQDIELATPVRLLMRLQSFRVQREILEKKFKNPSEDVYVGKE